MHWRCSGCGGYWDYPPGPGLGGGHWCPPQAVVPSQAAPPQAGPAGDTAALHSALAGIGEQMQRISERLERLEAKTGR